MFSSGKNRSDNFSNGSLRISIILTEETSLILSSVLTLYYLYINPTSKPCRGWIQPAPILNFSNLFNIWENTMKLRDFFQNFIWKQFDVVCPCLLI